MNKEALSWLDKYNQNEKEEIISWFNNKLDILVAKQVLLQFNNTDNTLSDVVNCIKDMALISISPDLTSTPKEFKYYISITENKDDITILTHKYCEKKFDKVLT